MALGLYGLQWRSVEAFGYDLDQGVVKKPGRDVVGDGLAMEENGLAVGSSQPDLDLVHKRPPHGLRKARMLPCSMSQERDWKGGGAPRHTGLSKTRVFSDFDIEHDRYRIILPRCQEKSAGYVKKRLDKHLWF